MLGIIYKRELELTGNAGGPCGKDVSRSVGWKSNAVHTTRKKSCRKRKTVMEGSLKTDQAQCLILKMKKKNII